MALLKFHWKRGERVSDDDGPYDDLNELGAFFSGLSWRFGETAQVHPTETDLYLDDTSSSVVTSAEHYVTSGGKWGASGAAGTGGGTVTWSIASAGWNNSSADASWFSGTTVNFSSFLSFDYVAVLTQAFAAWSTVADITFV